MTTYGFDFIAPDGRIHAVDVGAFASDAAAAGHARKILFASLTAVAVDIWCDKLKIVRIDRRPPDPAALGWLTRRRPAAQT